MSVQFGKWNFDGRPVEAENLEKAKALLAPYGPDAPSTYHQGGVAILYHAFYTTEESRRQPQPYISPSGDVITWDGRLDNRTELVGELGDVLTARSTDVAIFAAAYERWGVGCFSKIIGDWAVSVWSPTNRSLILAKDPIGIRHLFYSLDKDQVSWSSTLDPLILLARKSLALEEEYIAGWLSFFPATHLTPYVGIHSVPPSSFVSLDPTKRTVRSYWDFDAGKRIRYRTDGEYEEHFRAVFGESVRRRLRSDHPVLAELSGGMDSSSIVCMADSMVTTGAADGSCLDTVSFYDESEPNWNERPYFTLVERKRGRTGCHIDVGSPESFVFDFEQDRFAATPGSCARITGATRQFKACAESRGSRVVLSGIGGDEVTGGVPSPMAELRDLLAKARFRRLAHQLKAWALNKKKPWFHLLWEAALGFLPPELAGPTGWRKPPNWLMPDFTKRQRAALRGYGNRTRLFGAPPSFQDNVSTLEALRRQLASSALPSQPLLEKRYPYLDCGLLEFLYAIPGEQLVRPGQRRSLMRRALAGIVPDQVLNRRRKAFVARAPMLALARQRAILQELTQHMISAALGIVDPVKFSAALPDLQQNHVVPIIPLMRAVGLEIWLRNLRTAADLRSELVPWMESPCHKFSETSPR